jgi:hypothetical protein
VTLKLELVCAIADAVVQNEPAVDVTGLKRRELET